jgi:hypothetical protein
MKETMSMECTWMENGPIYIGGPDRCGKTTLRAFLASHSRIAIPAVGSNMWTYFYGQYGDLGRPENFEHCLRDMLHYKHVHFLQPDPERIRREFWEGPPTYARLFALFLIHFAEREGKPRWGAQTGLIERYADQLFAAYPAAKIVHMIRDPRDRYEASLALWPNGKGRAGGATARWRYSVGLARRNQRKYPDRYKVVRFESMILQPEETLRDVCEFLDEAYEPAMLAMEGAPKHRTRMEQGLPDPAAQVSPVSTDFIGLFRQKISKRELAFMQMWAGREMRACGYAAEPLNFTPADWLRFASVEFPLNLGKMVAWRTWEAIQHHFPQRFGRQPGRRMILDASAVEGGSRETQPA